MSTSLQTRSQKEAKHDQIQKNEEIQAIKKIMGLQHNKKYQDVSRLRYGKIMIMTDQDHDDPPYQGPAHQFLGSFFPIPSQALRIHRGICHSHRQGNTFKNFFTISEYERWHENMPGSKNWVVKYYEGLGTSDDKDAWQYFSQMEKHMIPFAETRDGDRENIDLAFSKKKADERKEWLRSFRPGTFLDHSLDEIMFSEFINKELILFSMADNI
ncbi:DNA topoisomerase [Flagelloscypha sp. PMI_526]|nr:DNA topoisomerase [Flagelloscypha sp. PMI_526]